MKIEFTEQQRMIRDMVREFSEKEVAPGAAERDEKEEFPTDVLSKMGDLGLLGINVPQEYGGAGLDTISYSIVVEEISKACASTGAITSVHNSFAPYIINRWGTDEQKSKYLPDLASGKKLGAFGGTEPNAGSDLGTLETTAALDGDHYVINGAKTFITAGSRADIIIVLAVTDKDAGSRGISAFIVESDFEGFKVGAIFDKMGIHASETSELIFEDMKVPKENLIGEEGEGYKIGLIALDGGRIGIASQAIGIAQAALDESIEYSKTRNQFGRPISKFQAIQWMISEMATKIEASRLLTWKAANMKDKGVRFSKEAAIAKLMASETAVWCVDKAVQIHGGYGYIKEYKVERLYRDAKITEIYEGTSEIQKLVIAHHMLK